MKNYIQNTLKGQDITIKLQNL